MVVSRVEALLRGKSFSSKFPSRFLSWFLPWLVLVVWLLFASLLL